jgi:hypothetical protein
MHSMIRSSNLSPMPASHADKNQKVLSVTLPPVTTRSDTRMTACAGRSGLKWFKGSQSSNTKRFEIFAAKEKLDEFPLEIPLETLKLKHLNRN